jgi:hypothetical protein
VFFWKPRTEQARHRARHASRPYRDAHIGVSVVSICYHYCCIAVLRCPEAGRERSDHRSGIPAGYFLPAGSSSLIRISQRAASHTLARRGQTLGRDSGAGTAKKVLADLSCDRCLMQLTRVASHQTPGAVDEPIGVGFEVTMLLLQVPHPLPCHE